MSSEIIFINDKQKEFSNRYVIRIDMKDTTHLSFYFKPNFPSAEKYRYALNEITDKASQRMVGKPASARDLYTIVVKELIEYFNPLSIGIIIDPDIENMFKKQDEHSHALYLYTETFKHQPCTERPSFEEWANW